MIELGSMSVHDQESITAARVKVLGVVRAFGASEVTGTRAATAVSEAARRCLAAGGGTIGVALVGADQELRLQLKIWARGATIDPAPLLPFFERVTPPQPGSGGPVTAELMMPAALTAIDPDLISRERARIATKTRTELMEELRLTNRQLEEHNEKLEATVAERTAELRHTNEQMQRDLDAGAAYVRALIPEPMTGHICVDWRYVPSSNLGGDTIGYHWLDDEHLVFYLIDVTGHGLDSALLAVTVTNVIRAGTLPAVDMRRPEQVVAALNEAFQSDRHGQKYFTIWYGVYEPKTRRMTWSSAGHHPAVLQTPSSAEPLLLPASGPMVGCSPGLEFPAESCTVPAGSRFMLFSDGVFEILREDRVVWNLQGAIDYLSARAGGAGDESVMDPLLLHVHAMRGTPHLDDDFSFIEAVFP